LEPACRSTEVGSGWAAQKFQVYALPKGKRKWCAGFPNVMACAAGRSSVWMVTRTAGMKLSMYRALRLYLIVADVSFFFYRPMGIFMTIGHI